VRQHVIAANPSASVGSPIRLAALRAARRAMRQTNFCLLTSLRTSTRASFGSRPAHGVRGAGVIACLTSVRFASVGSTSRSVHRGGRCLPARDACDPYLWRPVALPTDVTIGGDGRDRSRPDRVNDAGRDSDPGHLPSKQGPPPRSALSSARLGPPPASRFGHHDSGFRHLFAPGILADPLGCAPVHATRCQRIALFWASVTLADFCNLKTTREHTLRAFNPRTRAKLSLRCRHEPVPVALA